MTPKRAQLGNGPSANPFRASPHQFKASRCSLENDIRATKLCNNDTSAKCLNFHLERVQHLSRVVVPCKDEPTAMKIQLFLLRSHFLRHATSAPPKEGTLAMKSEWTMTSCVIDETYNLPIEGCVRIVLLVLSCTYTGLIDAVGPCCQTRPPL